EELEEAFGVLVVVGQLGAQGRIERPITPAARRLGGDAHRVSGGQPPDVAKEGPSAVGEDATEVVGDASLVELVGDRSVRSQRLDLGREQEHAGGEVIVQGTDPDRVASAEQAPVTAVPDGEREVAEKPPGTRLTPAQPRVEE